MSSAHEPAAQPLAMPTVRGVLVHAIGERAADKAIDALVLHLHRHYSGGGTPTLVLQQGHLHFSELLRIQR